MVSDSNLDNTLGVSQSKLQEYKDMLATAKEGNIPAGYVTVSHFLLNHSNFDINNRFYRELTLVRAAPQATITTCVSFMMANCGASSVPTIMRDAPCSQASLLRKSVNGPTPVLPSNDLPQLSTLILSFFGLY